MVKLTAAGCWFPASAEGVQFNFCKSIRCAAFGVPETPHAPGGPRPRRPHPATTSGLVREKRCA